MASASLKKAQARIVKLFKFNPPNPPAASSSTSIDYPSSQPSTMERSTSDIGVYPTPIIIPPTSGQHRQSFIILHGRGSEGDMFGRALLRTPVTGGYGRTLPNIFPDAKFIFPTAAKRRAQVYEGMPIHQWFDNWSLQDPNEQVELQFDGLRESSVLIHALLEAEIQEVGAENVILWGLSQGCALGLVSLLLWQGPRYAAAVGMCGWLPLQKRMSSAMGAVAATEDDLFARDEERGSDGTKTSKLGKAIAYLRGELEMASNDSSSSSRAPEIPVFLGHGAIDPKVPAALSREAAAFLCQVDVDVEHKEYEGLAHWYSSDMLGDIVQFIERKARWRIVKEQVEQTD